MVRGLWHTLELMQSAVMVAWQRDLGPQFATIKPYLKATGEVSDCYPCPDHPPCLRDHEVRQLDDSRWLAVADGEWRACATATLTAADVTKWAVDVGRFARDTGRWLEFTPPGLNGPLSGAPRFWPAGTHGPTKSPVFLALCFNPTQMLTQLQCLMGACGEPFIVLAPTGRNAAEPVRAFLQRERCAFVELNQVLRPQAGPAGLHVTDWRGADEPLLKRFEVAAPLAIGRCEPHGRSESGTQKAVSASRTGNVRGPSKHSGTRGRLRYENNFCDIWLGEERYDLRERNKARLCIQYLFEKGAFDKTSARHFEKQIDPYVRKHSNLEPLPDYAEVKLHHYFNPSTGRIAQLGRDLVWSAGRGTGRYFLNVA